MSLSTILPPNFPGISHLDLCPPDHSNSPQVSNHSSPKVGSTSSGSLPRVRTAAALSNASSPSNQNNGTRRLRGGHLRTVGITNFETIMEARHASREALSTPEDYRREKVGMSFSDLVQDRKQLQKQLHDSVAFTTHVNSPAGPSRFDAYKQSRAKLNGMIDDLQTMQLNSQGKSGIKADGLTFLADNAFVGTDRSNLTGSGVGRDKRVYDSVALYAELRYIELKEREKDHGLLPTRLKAAVVGDLLRRIGAVIPGYSQIIEPLVWELLNCIFIDFAKVESQLPPTGIAEALASLPTYFEQCHVLRDEADEANAELDTIRQGHRMKDIVKKFQTVRLAFQSQERFVRDACFLTWKQYFERRRRLRQIALIRSMRYRWNRWRDYGRNRQQREMEDFAQTLDDKIQRLTELSALFEKTGGSPLLQAKEISGNIEYLQLSPPALQLPSKITSISRSSSQDSTTSNNASSTATATVSNRRQSVALVETQLRKALGSHLMKSSFANASSPRNLPNFHLHIDTSPVAQGEASASFTNANTSTAASHTGTCGVYSVSTPLAAGGAEVMETSYQEFNALASQMVLETTTVMTQTPDSWMDDYAALRTLNNPSLLRPSNALLRHHLHQPSAGTPRGASSDGVDPSNGVSLAVTPTQSMTLEAARHLVVFVYERKLAEMASASATAPSCHMRSLLDFTKSALLARYQIKRISNKYYKDLVSFCVLEAYTCPRLELFGRLCGLTLANLTLSTHDLPGYDEARANFFFHLLSVLFADPNNAKCINMDHFHGTFASNRINRDFVLAHLPELFATIETHEHIRERLIFDVIELPCVDHANMSTNFLIDLDEVLMLLMDYYPLETSDNPDVLFAQLQTQQPIEEQRAKRPMF